VIPCHKLATALYALYTAKKPTAVLRFLRKGLFGAALYTPLHHRVKTPEKTPALPKKNSAVDDTVAGVNESAVLNQLFDGLFCLSY
jgi:hypothetical protein